MTTKRTNVLDQGRPIQGIDEPGAAYRKRLAAYTKTRDAHIRKTTKTEKGTDDGKG